MEEEKTPEQLSAQQLSKRIAHTSDIIDALAHDGSSLLSIAYLSGNYSIPPAFVPFVRKAVHAVLVQCRALDTLALARKAGVPATSEGEVTVVVQGPKALTEGEEP